MHRTQLLGALIACTVGAAACDFQETGRVRLDLSALAQHAAQAAVPLARLELSVTASDFVAPVVVEVDLAALEVELELPAGLGRVFTVIGESDLAGARLVSYWGEAVRDVPARSSVDVVLPAFPAGTLRGAVYTADGAPLPADLTIRFVAAQPRPDAPKERVVLVAEGGFVAILPTGTYTLAVEFVRDGVRYAPLQAELAGTVGHAEDIFIDPIVLAPPNFCSPALGLYPDVDGDGYGCEIDCDDTDAALNWWDADLDGYTSCGGDCDDNDALLHVGDYDGDGVSSCAGDCADSVATCLDDCTTNSDADGMPDCADPCPLASTNDEDFDGVCDDVDNCLGLYDPFQFDSDGDGQGDSCDKCPAGDDDLDADGDGVPDGCDGCAGIADGLDSDGDALPDGCDLCPGGDDRFDTDADGIPDACDLCPFGSNSFDLDGDGTPDACDLDADNDGVQVYFDPNDLDVGVCGDSEGDSCDDCSQRLGDAFGPGSDAFPGSDGVDADADGYCNVIDMDDDNDGVFVPADPDDANFSVCGDSDGDLCDDCSQGLGDGFGIGPDVFPGSDGPDTDGDGSCNLSDTDADNDGVLPPADPDDANPAVCGSSDGDTCDDCSQGFGDGFGPGPDAFPSSDGLDFDGDGACDASDADADNDGVSPPGDPNDFDFFSCGSADADGCDDCSQGSGDGFGPGSDAFPNADGTDVDGDGQCNVSDADDDNDGISVPTDPDDASFAICGSSDGDTCDDCSQGLGDGFGPGPDHFPSTDGPDFDSDGNCDASDTDDDNDGVPEGADPNELDFNICGDLDADSCDDCVLTGDVFNDGPDGDPSNDGTDFDSDGQCDTSDTDADNDGVSPPSDTNDFNVFVCGSADADTCDDCSAGAGDGFGPGPDAFPANDGPDFDADGMCDTSDPDTDNDGVLPPSDPNDFNFMVCGSADADTCDDCSVTGDPVDDGPDGNPSNDGPDLDGDGQCDLSDSDDDNDGVLPPSDPNDADPFMCGNVDADGCDDCAGGLGDGFGPLPDGFPASDGPDWDSDGQCDYGDLDDDNDGVNDGADVVPANADRCGDGNGDQCDDCAPSPGPDMDLDGKPDSCDDDIDNDGQPNGVDLCPRNVSPQSDDDQDGVGNDCDQIFTASSCADLVGTPIIDRDGDGVADCRDGCFDVDGDNLGLNMLNQTVGRARIPVGKCTMDGVTPCTLLDPACSGVDTNEDADLDTVLDQLDNCIDADFDNAGYDGGSPLDSELLVENVASGGRQFPALARVGGAHVAVWADDRQGGAGVHDIWVSRFNGAVWSTAAAIQPGPPITGNQTLPAVAARPDASLVVAAWQDDGSGTFVIRAMYSLDGGNSWSGPVPVSDAGPGPRELVALAADADASRIYAVWQDRRGPDADIYMDFTTNGSTWGTDVLVAGGAADQKEPSVVAAYGEVHVVYTDANGPDANIFLRSSYNGGMSFAPPLRITNDFGPSGNQSQPKIAMHPGQRKFAVVWKEERYGNPDIGVATAWGSVSLWSPNALVAGGPDIQDEPAVLVADDGMFHVLYTDHFGPNYEVMAARSDNGKEWQATVPIAPSPGNARSGAMAPWSASSVLGVWIDEREVTHKVYSARRLAGCRNGSDCDDTNAGCMESCEDVDADGVCAGNDCDDHDASVSPLLSEACDFLDNNCDGRIDEGVGNVRLAEGMEAGAPSWTHAALSGADNWALVSSSFSGPASNPPGYQFPSVAYGTDGNAGVNNEAEDSYLQSPPATIPAPVGYLGLSFMSYSFNRNACMDGEDRESVEVSFDAGPFNPLNFCPDFALEEPPYSGDMRNVFYMISLMAPVSSAQLRFHFDTMNTNGNGVDDGWYIDDVVLYECTPPL